jgi:hypothetical protein
MADYRRMLEMAKDLNDYFNTGKRIAVGSTLRMQREVDQRYDRDARPPWRASGGAARTFDYDRPSKYQQSVKVHAKVNTGLSKIEPIDEQSELKRNTKEHEGQQQKLGADMHGIANQHYKLDPVVGGMNYETLSYLFERTSQPFYNNAA